MSASPNPNQVMSTLRMLGDQELGQYAKMHKSDPYIFPLAFQESMLRKQMRSQGAAQQQGPGGPPPPVNQQALASMQSLPESSGIARIAPPGVANMAAGGIVGFADGGSPEDPWVVQKVQEAAAYVRQNGGSIAKKLAEAGVDIASIPANTLQRMIAPISTQMGRAFGTETRIPGAVPQPMPDTSNYSNEGRGAAGEQPFDRITGTAPAAPAVAPVPEAKPGVPPAAGQGAGGTSSRVSMSASGSAPSGPGFKLESFTPKVFDPQATWDKSMEGATKDPLAAERRVIADRERGDATAMLEERKGISAEQSKLFDKQEARLAGRQENIEKEGKRNEAMGWITAGLEMLQARGPGLAAVASGAKKGFDQYGAGLEKLKEAQDRLDNARDGIDNNRLGAKKEMAAAQGEYRKALTESEKGVFAGLKEVYGWKREEAKVKLEMLQKGVQHENEIGMGLTNNRNTIGANLKMNADDNATRMAAARMQAAASGAYHNKQLEYLRAVAGDPVLMAAHKSMEARGGGDPSASFVKFYSELPDMPLKAGQLSKATPMNQVMSQWLGIQTGLGGISAPKPIQGVPGATTIRP